MKYYNETLDRWYYKGTSITKILSNGSVFSGIPTTEQLQQWGYTKYIEPEEESVTLEDVIQQKLNQINEYDSSDAVNIFYLGESPMWLDANTRQQLRTSIKSYEEMGYSNVSKWFDGIEYTFDIPQWLQMLNALEIYASEALNVTEQHKSNIQNLETIEEIENYDYTTNYPEKLRF